MHALIASEKSESARQGQRDRSEARGDRTSQLRRRASRDEARREAERRGQGANRREQRPRVLVEQADHSPAERRPQIHLRRSGSNSAAHDLLAHSVEREARIRVVRPQLEHLAERRSGAAEVAAVSAPGLRAAHVCDSAIVAGVRMDVSAIGKQLQSVDRIIVSSLIHGKDSLAEELIVRVAVRTRSARHARVMRLARRGWDGRLGPAALPRMRLAR